MGGLSVDNPTCSSGARGEIAAVLQPLCPRFSGASEGSHATIQDGELTSGRCLNERRSGRDDSGDDVEPVNGEMIVEWKMVRRGEPLGSRGNLTMSNQASNPFAPSIPPIARTFLLPVATSLDASLGQRLGNVSRLLT